MQGQAYCVNEISYSSLVPWNLAFFFFKTERKMSINKVHGVVVKECHHLAWIIVQQGKGSNPMAVVGEIYFCLRWDQFKPKPVHQLNWFWPSAIKIWTGPVAWTLSCWTRQTTQSSPVFKNTDVHGCCWSLLQWSMHHIRAAWRVDHRICSCWSNALLLFYGAKGINKLEVGWIIYYAFCWS